MGTLVGDRLNELYKKYFQETDYKLGQSFDSVRGNMTDEDYDLSQKLLNYYGQQNTLAGQYNHSTNIVEQERKKALQENAIAKEKAMKYLPEYLNLQGMGGLGVSQSAVIKARNNFNNNRNSINTNANSQLAELLNNYKANANNLDQNYLSDAEGIRSKYQAIEDEKLTNQYNSYLGMLDNGEFSNADEIDNWYKNIKGTFDEDRETVLNERVTNYKNKLYNQETQNIYDELSRKIQEGEFNTTDELENYYNSVKGRFNESQNSIIGSQIDFFKQNLAQQQADAEYKKQQEVAYQEAQEQAEKDERILTGKEYISYGGNQYRITSTALNSNANELRKNDNFTKQLKKACGTSNPFDSSIPNGTTLTFKATSSGKDDVDGFWGNVGRGFLAWTSLGATELAFGETKTVTLTYYNGNWYKSKKV